jgi:ABC-type Na+ transport system ATPase subunit NatA
MYYTSFRIQNFKGIKDTTIKLAEQSKAGVFAFVGLNESGKTTILEAIHSFSPDLATSEVVGGEGKSGVPYKNRVPRHLISSFTGDVSVTATLRISEDERGSIVSYLSSKHNLTVDPATIPDDLPFERHQRFHNGDFVRHYFTMRCSVLVKTGRQRHWRSPSSDELLTIRDEIYSRTPDIAYFPTFVFDFPKRIFLTKERGDKVSNFYRQAFQDILDYDGKGHTIENSIIRRIRSDEKRASWLDFLNIWNTGDDKDKIQHVMDRASATVTEVVFGRWNEIFGEDAKGKEIHISFETLEGEIRDQSGAVKKTNEHDLFVKFQIKDGTRRFDVNDRSLGFRWFFSFMMFTQFRVAREGARPILFLFDEPASNLHAAAQQKLIDSFPEIAKGNHTLAYSTHSHYMIEPKWLEQTFIVTNRADSPGGSVIEGLSLSDESLDIQATRYRAFVGEHPNQTNYFQPVLDRLQVVPSRFDIDRASVIVEGKSDYYVLRYAAKLLGRPELHILPGLGAGTFGALIALHLGWGVGMVALLDGDKKGKQEKDRYRQEFGLRTECILTLDDLLPGVTAIEDVLGGEAKDLIRSELGLSSSPSKSQIWRYFQECLARDDIAPLGKDFKLKAAAILDGLKERLAAAS